MKNSNDTVGNRTRNLPACSAVPQPTAPRTVAKRDPTVYISHVTNVGLTLDMYQRIYYTLNREFEEFVKFVN